MIQLSFLLFFLLFVKMTGTKQLLLDHKKKAILPLFVLLIGNIALWSFSFTKEGGILGALLAYLAFNTYTDEIEKSLYVFPSYVMMVLGVLYLVAEGVPDVKAYLLHFGIYAFLQLFLFSKMYASGDVRMFLITGLFLNPNIIPWQDKLLLLYMLHMAISLVFFLLYNGSKKNITKTLRLKEPMPFGPAIAFATLCLI